MRLVPGIAWSFDGPPEEPLDVRLVPLLRAIEDSTTLVGAAASVGLSYRAAWGLLRDYERRLGEPLVAFSRGRGARLTPSGMALLRAETDARRHLQPAIARLALELGPRPAPSVKPRSTLIVRVAASHDLALAALRDALPAAEGLKLELAFKGSLEALAEFAQGRVDIAGFHVPIGRRAPADLAPFRRWLNPARDRLIRFVDRDQGLMVAPGNPHRVKSFRDVVAKRLRFVNRQRGSGTRLLVDGLLARGRIDPSDIPGYTTEEYTHPAVAATVASGSADVGFGVRAAAAEYGLAFVPLVPERYFLAVRSAAVGTPHVDALVRALGGPVLAKLVARLPGYDAAAAGLVVEVASLDERRSGGREQAALRRRRSS